MVKTASDAKKAVEAEEQPSYSDTVYRNLPLDEKVFGDNDRAKP